MPIELNPDTWEAWIDQAVAIYHSNAPADIGPLVVQPTIDRMYDQWIAGQTPRRALERLKLIPVEYVEPQPPRLHRPWTEGQEAAIRNIVYAVAIGSFLGLAILTTILLTER